MNITKLTECCGFVEGTNALYSVRSQAEIDPWTG